MFSTLPANPFPPSTSQMNAGDNTELNNRVQALEISVTGILNGTSIDSFGDVETALATKANNEIIAPLFDETSGIYFVGDLVVYDGVLYQFTSAHETAGSWDISEVSAVKVSDELATLKSGLTNITKNITNTATLGAGVTKAIVVKTGNIVSISCACTAIPNDVLLSGLPQSVAMSVAIDKRAYIYENGTSLICNASLNDDNVTIWYICV